MTSHDDVPQSLEEKIQAAGGPVPMLRGPGQLGPYVFPGIAAEFTNWRDEVRSWKDGAALLEQSYHMTELHLRGREVVSFLATVAVNKFDPFPVRKAKQIVVASPDGYLVGDAILFHEESDFLRIVGRPFALDWVQFHADSSSFDVEATLDHNSRCSSIRAMSSASRCRVRRLGIGDGGCRRHAPGGEVLQHRGSHHRRQARPRSAPRNGWNSWLRDLWKLG